MNPSKALLQRLGSVRNHGQRRHQTTPPTADSDYLGRQRRLAPRELRLFPPTKTCG